MNSTKNRTIIAPDFKTRIHDRINIIKHKSKHASIVVLCGSYRFEDEIIKSYKRLTDEGYIVLMPAMGCCGNDKEFYVNIHRQKIDLADIVFIVNKNGYIGEDTINEIKYAELHKKEICYLE